MPESHKFKLEAPSLEYNPVYNAPFSERYDMAQREQNRQAQAELDAIEAGEPSTLEQVSSAFKVHNPVGAYMAAEMKPLSQPVEGYKVEEDIQGYEHHWKAFRGSNSPANTAWIKRSLDSHEANEKVLNDGDWVSTVSSVGAAVADPFNLILMAGTMGVGSGLAAGRVGLSAGRNVASGLVATAASEATLHKLQPGRSAEETHFNFAATAIIDGLTGGVVGALTKDTRENLITQIAKNLSEGPEFKGSVGADFVGGITSGAPLKPVQPIWDYTGMGWLAKKMTQVTPNGRLASSELEETRRAVHSLSEMHMKVEGDSLPTAAETLINVDKAHSAERIIELRKLARDSGMDSETFAREWADAMRFGITDDTTPEVAEAATMIRSQVYDDLWQRATEAGVEGTYYEKLVKDLTPEELAIKRADGSPWVSEEAFADSTVRMPVSQNTAPGYLQRHYDVNKVRGHRLEFEHAVREGIEDQHLRTNTDIDSKIDALHADPSARGDLEDLTVIDHFENTKDVQKTVTSEAARAKSDAIKKARTAYKAEVKESHELEQSLLEKLDVDRANVKTEIDNLQGAQEKVKASFNRQIARVKGTNKEVAEAKRELKARSKAQVAEIVEAEKRLKSELVSMSKSRIRKDAVEARRLLEAKKNQTLQAIDSEIAKLKRLKSDVSFKDYSEAKARFTKAEREFQARLDDLENQRPRELDNNEWAEVTANYYDNVTHLKPGDFHANASQNGNSMFKHRVDIKDEFLNDFLETDPENLISSFTNALAPKIRLSEIDGPDGDFKLSGMLGRIKNDYDLMRGKAADAGDIKLSKKLEAKYAQETGDVIAIRDGLLGNSIRSTLADTNPLIASGLRTLRNWNGATKLNAVVIASIPDLARQMTYGAFGKYARSFSKALNHIGLDNLPEHTLARLSAAATRVQDARMQDLMLMEDVVPMTKVEQVSKYLGQKAIKWGGLQHMDSMNKTLSGYMVADRIVNDLRSLKGLKNLKHLGIDDNLLPAVQKLSKRFAVDEDGLINPRLDLWKATDGVDQLHADKAVEAFEAAVMKETNRLTMTPGIGDKPIFMSHELGKTIFQFKSFIIGAANRITLPLMQEDGTRPFLEILSAVGLGVLAVGAKHVSTGRPLDTDPELIAKDALDRSGVTAYAMEAYNTMNKVTGYDPITDIRSRVTGDDYESKQTSKYRSRDNWGAILGVSAGTFSDFIKAGSAGSNVDTRMRAIRRAMPFQNHWFFRQGIDKIEGEAARALGGTGKYATSNKPAASSNSRTIGF